MKLFNRIDTVIVRVSSLERSISWYCDHLQSFEVIYRDVSARLAVLSTGEGTSLTLWETDQPLSTAHANTAAYPILATTDATAAHELLRARGVDVAEIVIGGGVSSFQFRDIDGNLLEACQVHVG